MKIVGISAFYHDSACALVVDGEVLVACQEERFTRLRYEKDVPMCAFRACLDHAGLNPADIDCVAYYEDPVKKLGRQLWMEPPGRGGRPVQLDATAPERLIREQLGFDGRFEVVDHHEAHAASAFYCSGFTEAALLTADAVGEWATTSYGHGSASGISLLEEVAFPHSIGLLYSTITSYLGFSANSDEYKVMGLAAYGKPRFRPELEKIVMAASGGQFKLDPRYFSLGSRGKMYTRELSELLGIPPRPPQAEVTADHQDLAASIQSLTEDLLHELLGHLYRLCPSDNLGYAGGVALNCVANTRLRRASKFRNWFIPPAPGDAGSSVGAAMLLHHRLTGSHRAKRLADARLGPRPAGPSLAQVLGAAGVAYEDFAGRQPGLLTATARPSCLARSWESCCSRAAPTVSRPSSRSLI
jgi:carbamoyltransferase